MGKGFLFFCCSCVILALTIVNLSIGPAISGRAVDDDDDVTWGNLNCAKKKDDYDKADDGSLSDADKKGYEVRIDKCERRKAMYNMEYTSFIFDIVIGFVCGLLGLLHIFEVKKDFVANTGLIGLICGIIGFVLTLVYVIFNGLVFTSNYSDIKKSDENSAYAEYDSTNDEYKCLYFDDSGDILSVYAKYSELNKKQYNYDKDLHKAYETSLYSSCRNTNNFDDCADEGKISFSPPSSNPTYTDSNGAFQTCPYLYVNEQDDITNQDVFDRFLTTLILSLVVCLANIGIALFGFLLFKTPGEF